MLSRCPPCLPCVHPSLLPQSPAVATLSSRSSQVGYGGFTMKHWYFNGGKTNKNRNSGNQTCRAGKSSIYRCFCFLPLNKYIYIYVYKPPIYRGCSNKPKYNPKKWETPIAPIELTVSEHEVYRNIRPHIHREPDHYTEGFGVPCSQTNRYHHG